jgi:hypothetical protein
MEALFKFESTNKVYQLENTSFNRRFANGTRVPNLKNAVSIDFRQLMNQQ